MKGLLSLGWALAANLLWLASLPATAGDASPPEQGEAVLDGAEVRPGERLGSAKAGETKAEAPAGPMEWTQRFRPSGNADAAFLYGLENSVAPDGRFVVDNARLFLDVQLGEDFHLVDRPLVASASFFLEWDIAREASLKNEVGSLYARFDGLVGIEALNLKLGRMPVPFGVDYVRWSEERPSNPLLTFAAFSPYGWDEGFLLFGAAAGGWVDYGFAVMDGDKEFGVNTSTAPALVGKLALRPAEGVEASLSGIRTGKLGDAEHPANSALEFGGTHAVPFGSGTDLPSFQDGVEVEPVESPSIRTMTAWEADLTLEREDTGRLWLGYGQVRIEADGLSAYDRMLHYGVAEGVLDLGLFCDLLRPLYLAARYSVFGTFDRDRGYLIEALDGGDDLGFNTRAVQVASAGLGFRPTRILTIKAQYARYDFALVRGVPREIRDEAGARGYGGVGISLGF